MLFPLALQTSPPVEMKWTGVVKAFAVYRDSTCSPNEIVGKAYVARKFYEDGSTVTYVRTRETNAMPWLRLSSNAEGWIDRDKEGAATRIVTKTNFPYEGLWGRPARSMETKFERKPEQAVLTGMIRGVQWRAEELILNEPKRYALDTLEGLAFGSLESLSAGWTLPIGIQSILNSKINLGDRVVGKRFVIRPTGQKSLVIGGRRESVQVFATYAQWLQNTHEKNGVGTWHEGGDYDGGSKLLFRSDGSLAAYIPSNTGNFFVGNFEKTSLPGTREPNPNQQDITTERFIGAISLVVLPTSPSASEFRTALNAIPTKYKPVPVQAAPVQDAPPQTTPPLRR